MINLSYIKVLFNFQFHKRYVLFKLHDSNLSVNIILLSYDDLKEFFQQFCY